MKILMATNYYASHRGGIEIVAGELFRGLAASGQEVVWIAADSTPPPEPIGRSHAAGLRVSNWIEQETGLPFPIPTLGAVRQIKTVLRQADIVILHDCLYLTNIATFLIARMLGVPIVIVQHTVPNERGIANALMKLATRLFTRPMLRRARQAVFISHTTRVFYSDLPFRASPEVIFNGVDCQMFHPIQDGETKVELRRRLGIDPEKPVILFVGRFVAKKGLPILKHMAALKPEYTWAFAGWGPLDPKAWDADNVVVFSGLQGAQLARLYRAADVLVLPSTKEGFPLVVQEALASGLSVVCGSEILSADPAMNPLVRGVLVCSHDEARTAREFLSAIDDAIAAAPQPGNTPRDRYAFAVSRYSWPNAIERYLAICSRLPGNALDPQVATQTAPENVP